MVANTSLFKNKATTLEWFRGKLNSSAICPSLIFKALDWKENPADITDKISQHFDEKLLIVRSSSSQEDDSSVSLAGMFESVPNVDSTSKDLIQEAIDTVINSYEKHGSIICENDLFFVQPMVCDVAASGVIFTRDINNGSPYYILNYDDVSGSTDSITSGTGGENRTLYIHRDNQDSLFSPRFKKLLLSVKEIEQLVPNNTSLDIEFAITNEEEVYILQVRPMSAQKNWKHLLDDKIKSTLKNVENFLQLRLRKSADARILGDFAIYSDMADWNPAEMIGTAPKQLATSLYREIITDSVWAEARAEMGYRDLSQIPLMVSFGGKPYIDVRNSFNSLLPADLDNDICEIILNSWLEKLRDEPWLHDKVEFEIGITCYSFDLTDTIERRFQEGLLTKEQKSKLVRSLKNLTSKIISSNILKSQAEKIHELERRRKLRGSNFNDMEEDALIAVIQALLIDCKLYGTKPFSIFARCAFIAEELLRSLQRTGILTSTRVEELKQKTPTVLSEFIESVDSYNSKNSDFLEKFGHLRPGTYDILSPRYDSFIEEHIEGTINNSSPHSNRPHQEDYELTKDEKNNIEDILQQEDLDFSAEELISFIQRAISYREWGKLHFTKNLSDALECLAALGERVGLNREDVSHVSIHNILKFAWNVGVKDLPSDLKNISEKEKEGYELTKALRFPSVISKVQDIYVAPLVKARPNFVTHKRVDGEFTFLSGAQTDSKLDDRIVIIEGADPGYDWIFLHSIKGLITKYGGTNSHMAIRCAELGIPAVIGCGEQLFEKLKTAQSVSIDCEAHTIRLVN